MSGKIKAVIRPPQKLSAYIDEPPRIDAEIGGRDTTPAKWRGEWQQEETYAALQKVSHLGSSYVCIKGCTGVDPEADVTLGDGVEGTCWILIAAKGKDGSDGAAFTYDMFTEEQLEALRGPEGPRGVQGIQGIPGERGAQGVQGIQGIQGERGAQGERGERGAAFTYDMFTEEQLEALRGPAGPAGKDGQDGQDGSPGPAGPAGSIGPQGPAGPAGPQGPQGERGPAGPAGSGTGDMTAAMYDPQGKEQDIFKYVDDKLKDVDFDVTADEVTFSDGQTFQQKYDSGDLTGPAGPQGPAGKDGQDGNPGAPGSSGADGVSPAVSVAAITGGHRITITDKNGTKTVDVMDGSDGAPGSPGATGADGQPGAAGKDATINGVNALTLTTGTGLNGSQSGDTYTLSLASHNQAASTITAGTFAGQVVANGSGQTYSTYLLRNTRLASSDTNPTVNGQICWTYG